MQTIRRVLGGVLALLGFLFALAGPLTVLVGFLFLWIGLALLLKGSAILRWGGGLILAFGITVIAAAIGGDGNVEPRFSSSGSRSSGETAGGSASSPSADSVSSRYPSFGAGSKVVGADIQPGTYRTRKRAPGCYWARLAGFSGELGDVLANGNESGPVVITISDSDKGFESRGCGTWTGDLSAITPSPSAPFGDGVYIVGTDIAPGTWRADNPAGCYWARLRGFSGQLGDVIANDNGSGIVTISASDRGFANTRCGTWTKVD